MATFKKSPKSPPPLPPPTPPPSSPPLPSSPTPTSRISTIKKSSPSSKRQSSYSKSPKMSPFEMRFYLIVAAVLLLCIAVLFFFIVDQVAMGGKWKKKWFAAAPTITLPPSLPKDVPDTTAVPTVPIPTDSAVADNTTTIATAPIAVNNDDVKIPPENNPENTGEPATKEIPEEERQQQEEQARQQQLIADELERVRREKEQRDSQIAESLTVAVENFPNTVPLAVPKMSAFGTLTEDQFVPYTIKELAPFSAVAANVTLTWSPVLVDTNTQFSLKKDTAEKNTEQDNTENATEKDTAVSPTWRLCADDQNGEKVLATVRFYENGLVFVWDSAATRDILNYSLLCKLPFAYLKCEVSHCDQLYQVSAGLFTAEPVETVEIRSFISQQGQATAKIQTLFGQPNREKAFAKMDTTAQLEWQPVLLPESLPDGITVNVEDQGKIKRILFTVEISDRGTVIFPVEGELFSRYVQFTDVSWAENNAIQKQRAELGNKNAAGELDEAGKLRWEELSTLMTLRTSARQLLRNSTLRLSFQLDAVAPNTTDRIRIMQYEK